MEIIDLNNIKNNINPENIRIKLAKDISAMLLQSTFYSDNEIMGILLGGSVSRGMDDEYSDIELLIFTKDILSLEDRTNLIATLKFDKVESIDYDNNEDNLIINGIQVDLMYYTEEFDIRKVDDVIDYYLPDYSTIGLIDTLDNGIILHGNKLLLPLKKKVNYYPSSLGENIVIDSLYHLHNGNMDILIERDNPTEFYSNVIILQKKIFNILAAVNRKYIGGYKWMYHEIETFKYKPDNLGKDFKSMFQSDRKKVVELLAYIVKETLTIVAHHFPELNLNIDELIKKYSYKRKK